MTEPIEKITNETLKLICGNCGQQQAYHWAGSMACPSQTSFSKAKQTATITEKTLLGIVAQHRFEVGDCYPEYRTMLLTSDEKDKEIEHFKEDQAHAVKVQNELAEKIETQSAKIKELEEKLKEAESMLDEAMRIICDTITSMKISLGLSTDLNRNFTLELYINLMEKGYEALKKLKG